jgi:alcohol dehydrogenase (cytochrome c)
MKTRSIALRAIVAVAIIVAGSVYVYGDKAVPIAAMAINYVRYLSAPAGTLTTELAAPKDVKTPTSLGTQTAYSVPAASVVADQTPGAAEGNWPSYNKTLTSDRYSRLSQINKGNVGGLKVQCT